MEAHGVDDSPTTTLRTYLSAGGRLNFDVHRELIDAMSTAPSWTADEREDRAMKARYADDTLVDGGDVYGQGHLTPGQRAEAVQANGFLAEYLDDWPDPGLDRMIQDALPEPLALHLEAQIRPHRIHVGPPECDDYWSCDNCGATFAAGEADALLVTDRVGHSRLAADIVICRDCVMIAASALSGASDDGL